MYLFTLEQDGHPSSDMQLLCCALSNIKQCILEMLIIQIGIEGSSLGCCSSVAQSCPTLYDPTDCNTPGFLVLHYLPEFAQIQVHWVDDAIQPSHPLSTLSPFALNLSQHQCLLQWVNSLHQALKYWSFSLSISPSNEYSRWILFRITGLIFLMLKGFSKVFSRTTV